MYGRGGDGRDGLRSARRSGHDAVPKCDSTLHLAEAHGVGTTDLSRIEVRGVPIEQALFPFSA